MDRVREEAFGKLIQHLTVQSRTYRIVCGRRVVRRRGKSRGRSTLEAIVVFCRMKPAAGSAHSCSSSGAFSASMRFALVLWGSMAINAFLCARACGQSPGDDERSNRQRNLHLRDHAQG